MDYKVLYRKYRPDSFKKIVGQDYIVNILKNAIINNKLAHAYIFNGPRGTGKTSTAKILAKTINCENPINGEACGKCNSCINIKNNPDIIEIDAASNNGVDEIRELIENIKIAPSYSKYKVYIIDEVHMMTQSAFNALLLTLEEPPKHVIFILATTNIESVPITILSRCQKFDFKKINIEDIKKNIQMICENENIKITDESIEEIAYLSEGGMRDALSLLDQLSSENDEINIDLISNIFGSVPNIIIKNIIDSLNNNDIELLTENINKLKDSNFDYKTFIKKMIDQLSIKAYDVNRNLNIEKIKEITFDLLEIINNYNININPFVLIEITLLKYIKETENDNIEKSKESKQIISREIICEKEINNQTTNLNQDNIEFDKKIRINNCFALAKKEFLTQAKQNIKKVIENNSQDSFLMSMLIDSDIVAASNEIYIMSSSLESIVNLININHEMIENKLNNIKIVGLTEEEWNNEKKIYINNLKKGIEYKIIDEVQKIEKAEKEETKENIMNNSMEDIASQLFSKNKIEIE